MDFIRAAIKDRFDEAIEEDFGKVEKPHDKWRNIYRAKIPIRVNGVDRNTGEEYPGWGIWPSKDIAYTKARENEIEDPRALEMREYLRTEKV